MEEREASPNLLVPHQPATYSVAATAARIGVAPATLRTWARRHDMGPTGHTMGQHRRYSSDDLAALALMRSLILKGSTATEAAAAAHDAREAGLELEHALHELAQAQASTGAEQESELGAEIEGHEDSNPWPEGNARDKTATNHPTPHHERPHELDASRAGADRPSRVSHLRIATDAASEFMPSDYQGRCAELVAAALRNDQERCEDLLKIRPSDFIAEWWKYLVRPAVDRLASHTVLAAPGQAPRLLIGYLAQRAIAEHTRRVRPDAYQLGRAHPSRLRNIVLVFADQNDELALPAHVLTSALLEKSCNAHVILGPENERRVTELVRIVRPTSVVFVSSHATPDMSLISALSDAQPELPIYVGLATHQDLGDLGARPNVSAIKSFLALFHEVYMSVRGKAPGEDYWEDSKSTAGDANRVR